MKLYLISQDRNSGYDTYDSAVVAAEDEDTARNISPTGQRWAEELMMTREMWEGSYHGWCSRPEDVEVKYLGEAEEGTPRSVICASFNAG